MATSPKVDDGRHRYPKSVPTWVRRGVLVLFVLTAAIAIVRLAEGEWPLAQVGPLCGFAVLLHSARTGAGPKPEKTIRRSYDRIDLGYRWSGWRRTPIRDDIERWAPRLLR